MSLGSFGGYILETHAGGKMGCEEKTGVLQVSGLSNWILIVRKQSLGEEVEGVFWTF